MRRDGGSTLLMHVHDVSGTVALGVWADRTADKYMGFVLT